MGDRDATHPVNRLTRGADPFTQKRVDMLTCNSRNVLTSPRAQSEAKPEEAKPEEAKPEEAKPEETKPEDVNRLRDFSRQGVDGFLCEARPAR
jgi:hypothetical protein